jgi:uncharacterized membrane protein
MLNPIKSFLASDNEIASLLSDIDALQAQADDLIHTQKLREDAYVYVMFVAFVLCSIVVKRRQFRAKHPDGVLLLLLIYAAYLLPSPSLSLSPSHGEVSRDLFVP